MSEVEQEIVLEEAESVPAGFSAESARKLQHAKVLPIHAASGSFGKVTDGRPKVVKRAGKEVKLPTTDDLQYLADMQEAELRFVEESPLVKATRGNANSADIFRLTIIGAAQNAASLEFQRIELQKRGEDTSQLISRHTKVLKEIAGLQGELRELGQQIADPRSEPFQKVFQLWAENVQKVVKESLGPEQADLFYTKFMTTMENWEDQAENAMR
jgi:hypothetical protein